MNKIRLDYQMRSFQKMYFSFYFTIAIFGGFMVPLITTMQISHSYLGLIMAAISCSGVAGQFVLGYLCDKLKVIKKVYIYGIAAIWIGLVIFFLTENIAIKIAMLVMIGFFFNPVMSMIDSWTLESNETLRQHFGAVRALGSLGWAMSAVTMGMLFDKYGWSIMPFVFVVFMLIHFYGIRNIPDGKHNVDDQEHITLKNVKELLKNTQYLQLLLLFILIYMAYYTVFTYTIVLIEDFGGTRIHVGFFLFMTAVSEMPAFFIIKRVFDRVHPSKVLIFASILFALRGLALNFCTTVYMVILTGIFQMFSFSPFISTTKRLVDDICPPELKTTSQMIAMAAFSGLAGLLAYTSSGIIADAYGISILMIITACIGLVGTAASVLYHKKYYSETPMKIEQKNYPN